MVLLVLVLLPPVGPMAPISITTGAAVAAAAVAAVVDDDEEEVEAAASLRIKGAAVEEAEAEEASRSSWLSRE